MENSKFFISVDLDNQKQVNAAAAFFNALNESNGAKTEPVPTARKKAVKLKTERAPEDKTPVEGVKDPTTATEKVDKSGGITVEEVRKLVIEKAKDHKAAIKAELTNLEAPNVTKLKEEHYPAFVKFLKSL